MLAEALSESLSVFLAPSVLGVRRAVKPFLFPSWHPVSNGSSGTQGRGRGDVDPS